MLVHVKMNIKNALRAFNVKCILRLMFMVAITSSEMIKHPCITVEDCFNITGKVVCKDEKCICSDMHVFVEYHMLCLPILKLGENCQYTEQCLIKDAHTECTYASNDDVPHKICRCAIGYEKKYEDGIEKCDKMYLTTVYEKNAKSLHFFGNGDSMPIIMSCLAAFLALLACFAGIFQFVRRKRSSRSSLRCGDPQHPQEIVTLNGSTPSQLPPASSDISPTGLFDSADFTPIDKTPASMSPIPLDSKQERKDLPPSYDEVLSHLRQEIKIPDVEEGICMEGDGSLAPLSEELSLEEQQSKEK